MMAREDDRREGLVRIRQAKVDVRDLLCLFDARNFSHERRVLPNQIAPSAVLYFLPASVLEASVFGASALSACANAANSETTNTKWTERSFFIGKCSTEHGAWHKECSRRAAQHLARKNT